MILSEGAGAVLLGRDGQITLDRVASGKNFATRKDAPSLLREIYSALNGKPEIIIASANGTFIDRAEEKAISLEHPHAIVYTPKPALGEGVSAGTMWQVIAGAQALLTGQLPSVPHLPAGKRRYRFPRGRRRITPGNKLSYRPAD